MLQSVSPANGLHAQTWVSGPILNPLMNPARDKCLRHARSCMYGTSLAGRGVLLDCKASLPGGCDRRDSLLCELISTCFYGVNSQRGLKSIGKGGNPFAAGADFGCRSRSSPSAGSCLGMGNNPVPLICSGLILVTPLMLLWIYTIIPENKIWS